MTAPSSDTADQLARVLDPDAYAEYDEPGPFPLWLTPT